MESSTCSPLPTMTSFLESLIGPPTNLKLVGVGVANSPQAMVLDDDGSLYLEDCSTKVILVREFSNMNKHKHGKGNVHNIDVINDKSLNAFNYSYLISDFPKGCDDSTENHVFLKFELLPHRPLYCRFHESINCQVEWTCLVSVVDSEGCLRYPQSLTLIYDGVVERPQDNIGWIQVVSADTLLREAEVLLSDDTLTIQVDMVLKQYYAGERCRHITFDQLWHSSFGKEVKLKYELPSRRLRLDSPLGELLRQESQYFERLCATPMVEKNSGYVEIDKEIMITFRNLVSILSYPYVESTSLKLSVTFKEILDIYPLANFYGIERILDTCRCWLRLICHKYASFLTEDDISAISEHAKTYNDPIFREILGVLARTGGETETQSGVEHEPWICKSDGKWPYRGKWIERFSFMQTVEIKKKEHVTEDVSVLSHCYI